MLAKAFCTKSSSWTGYKTCALSLKVTLEAPLLTSTSLHPFEQGMPVTRFLFVLLRRNMSDILPGPSFSLFSLLQLLLNLHHQLNSGFLSTQYERGEAHWSGSCKGHSVRCADLSTD